MPSMEIPWKEVFAPDSGTLLDVRVYDTTAADYDRLLGMLATQYRVLYLEDGNAKDLPDYATIIRRRDLVSVSIAVDVVGVEVKCFFWGENELTLDLRPEDVDSAELFHDTPDGPDNFATLAHVEAEAERDVARFS